MAWKRKVPLRSRLLAGRSWTEIRIERCRPLIEICGHIDLSFRDGLSGGCGRRRIGSIPYVFNPARGAFVGVA